MPISETHFHTWLGHEFHKATFRLVVLTECALCDEKDHRSLYLSEQPLTLSLCVSLSPSLFLSLFLSLSLIFSLSQILSAEDWNNNLYDVVASTSAASALYFYSLIVRPTQSLMKCVSI